MTRTKKTDAGKQIKDETEREGKEQRQSMKGERKERKVKGGRKQREIKVSKCIMKRTHKQTWKNKGMGKGGG